MKKHRILALFLAVFCILGSGCQKKTPTEGTALQAAELCTALLEEELPLDCDILCSYTEDRFADYFDYLYSIPMDYIKDGCIIYVASGASADEVSLLLPADAGKGAEITTALQNRIDVRKQDYNGYNKEEVEKLSDAVVTPIGNYIALIISDQPQTIAKALREKL